MRNKILFEPYNISSAKLRNCVYLLTVTPQKVPFYKTPTEITHFAHKALDTFVRLFGKLVVTQS